MVPLVRLSVFPGLSLGCNECPIGRQVTNPASLVQWDESDEGVTAAMEKALGGWVITEE